MAVLIPADSVTVERAKVLKKELTVVSKSNNFIFGKKNRYAAPDDKSLTCYAIEAEIGKSALFRVPFLFGYCNFRPLDTSSFYLPRDMKFTATFRDYQKELVDEAIGHLNDRGTATFRLRPGKGKTVMSIAVACAVKLLTCVLVFGDLTEQWETACRKMSTGRPWIVGLSDSDSQSEIGEADLIICMVTRVDKLTPEIRAKVGLLIIDEAHMFCNPTGINAILKFTPRHILACTATFKRTRDGLHSSMELFVGEHKVERPEKIDFKVLKIVTPFEATRVSSGFSPLDWGTLQKSLFYNDQRNRLITLVLRDLVNAGRKNMVFTDERRHTDVLQEELEKVGIDSDTFVGGKKAYRDGLVLVATTKKCGTGFDESNYFKDGVAMKTDAVMMTNSVATPERLEQTAGRSFRAKNPIIVQFVDRDPTVQKHWNQMAKKWHLANGGEIIEIDASVEYPNCFNTEGDNEINRETTIQKIFGKSGPALAYTMTSAASSRPVKKSVEITSVPGLAVIYNFIQPVTEGGLIGYLDDPLREWLPIGKSAKSRRVQHYGHVYNYTTKKIDGTAPPIEGPLAKLVEYMDRHHPLGGKRSYNQIIVNEYYRDQGISPHIDKIDQFGSIVMTLSLLEDVVMDFERGDEKVSVYLPRRSLAILSGDARKKWTHGIEAKINTVSSEEDVENPKRKLQRSKTYRRVSITMRHFKG